MDRCRKWITEDLLMRWTGRVQVEQVREIIKEVKTYGMEAGTLSCLVPGENETDIKETLATSSIPIPTNILYTVAYPIKERPLKRGEKFLQSTTMGKQYRQDIDFKRTYSRAYYHHAVEWINYECCIIKRRIELKSFLIKLKALRARDRMQEP